MGSLALVPISRIRRTSPIFPDKPIQSTLTAESDSVLTRSHELEIPSIPKSAETTFSEAGSGAVLLRPLARTFDIVGSGSSGHGGKRGGQRS